jgi:hypothetical protein
LVGAFKFDVDEDSSDIMLNELLIKVLVGGNTVDLSSIEDVIDTLTIKIGSEEFEADIQTDLTSATGTATYVVDFDDDGAVIDSGDIVDVKIYATFNETDEEANYNEGTTVKFSVLKADIDAEGEDDLNTSTDITGNFTSEEHTLRVDAVSVDLTSVTWTNALVSDTLADVYTAKFVFTVSAPEDQNIYLPLDTFAFGTAGDAGILFTKTGTGTTTDATLSSTAEEEDDGYMVTAGESETFTFTVDIEGDGTSHKIVIDSISYETEDDADANAATFDSALTTGLDDFKTATKTLYE